MVRTLVATTLGAISAIFAFALGLGGTGSPILSACLAAVAASVVIAFSVRRLTLEPRACSRGFLVVSGIAMLLAVVALGRLCVFMVDSSRAEFSSIPSSRWEVQHSCLSAYYVAGRAVKNTPNVYDDALYSQPGDPKALRLPRKLGRFNVDVYEYPPPFLLLPRLIGRWTTDFDRTRALWFGLTGGVLLLAMVWVARSIGPVAGTRALLLMPFVWFSLPTMSTLQKGNVQAMVIAGSMLAMILFQNRRWALGGVLLAFLTLSKLYPGMLIVYLLALRRWRALAWTCVASAVFLAISVADTGGRPYAAFLDHLPGLLSGEAFPAFRRASAIAVNYSVPGLVFKLGLFGVQGLSFGASRIVGWIYTVIAVAATVWAARHSWREEEKPLVWMAIVILATLRSPFLPQAYAALPTLWLLTLLAARVARSVSSLAVVLVGCVVANLYWPTDWPMDPRVLALLTGLPQALTIALAVFVLTRMARVGSREVAAEPALVGQT